MKKNVFFGVLTVMLSMALSANAGTSSGLSEVREHARFISDRMAYELNLSEMQYEDVYEVNFDFIYNTRPYIDGFAMRYPEDVNRYFYYLEVRNDDLRYILTYAQYERFLATEYFYRPVYVDNNRWGFRIYRTYTNTSYFYFDRPRIYKTYAGAHDRAHFNNNSYYLTNHDARYGASHKYYDKPVNMRRNDNKSSYRGATVTRPESTGRGEAKPTAVPDNGRNSRRTYTTPSGNGGTAGNAPAGGTKPGTVGNREPSTSRTGTNSSSRRTTSPADSNGGSSTRNVRSSSRNASTAAPAATSGTSRTSSSTTSSGGTRTAKRTR